jgi:hypothetical protein
MDPFRVSNHANFDFSPDSFPPVSRFCPAAGAAFRLLSVTDTRSPEFMRAFEFLCFTLQF